MPCVYQVTVRVLYSTSSIYTSKINSCSNEQLCTGMLLAAMQWHPKDSNDNNYDRRDDIDVLTKDENSLEEYAQPCERNVSMRFSFKSCFPSQNFWFWI